VDDSSLQEINEQLSSLRQKVMELENFNKEREKYDIVMAVLVAFVSAFLGLLIHYLFFGPKSQ
jgi:hypothetical protein